MSEKVIYDGWLKVFTKEVGDRTYELASSCDAVAAIVEDSQGKILLVEQYRPTCNDTTLEIPAGLLDIPGESSLDAMQRELQEEAGIPCENLEEVFTYFPHIGFCPDKLTIFHADYNGIGIGKAISDDDNVVKTYWVTKDELQSLILLGRIIDSKTIIAFFLLQKAD